MTAGLVMSLILLLLPNTALAAGNVSYQGQTEGIVFECDGTAVTELFVGFENVMPGDSMEETVLLRNDSPDGKSVKVYLKALGVESGEEFLSQLRLKVSVDGRQLAEGAADRSADLSGWVLLATLAPGEQQTLTMALEVPISLGNEYQEAVGALRWSFQVEEQEQPAPTPMATPNPGSTPAPGKGPGPKTGDASRPGHYAALTGASALVVLLLVKAGKSQKREEKEAGC